MREQIVVGKAEPRAPGLDTLVEVKDRARRGEILGTLCVAYAKKLVEDGFKVYATDTTSRGIQTENWEAVTPKPIKDVADTQEPTAEMEHPMESNL